VQRNLQTGSTFSEIAICQAVGDQPHLVDHPNQHHHNRILNLPPETFPLGCVNWHRGDSQHDEIDPFGLWRFDIEPPLVGSATLLADVE